MLGKRNRWTRHHLETEGKEAVATVMEIADGGMTVSHNGGHLVADTEVILKTRLRVEPLGEPAFEVHQRFRYSQFSIPSAGAKLKVRYDAEDHDKIMIDPAPPVVEMPGLPGGSLDVGNLLDTIRQTKASAPGDRMAMADAIKASMGLNAMVVDASGLAGGGEASTISQLERLSALHASGALTDAEFAAEKAKVLGS